MHSLDQHAKMYDVLSRATGDDLNPRAGITGVFEVGSSLEQIGPEMSYVSAGTNSPSMG